MHVTLNVTEQECFKYEHNFTTVYKEIENFKQRIIRNKLGSLRSK